MFKAKTIYIFGYSFIVLTILSLSCKDFGVQPPPTIFSASKTQIIVIKGANSSIILSGGQLPYAITTTSNVLIASSVLNGSTLTITGVDTGQTFVIIIDSNVPADTVKIDIRVNISPPSQSVSYSNQIQPIFNSQCTGCHGAEGGLSLFGSVSWNNLVNVNAEGNCSILKRVLPADASNSVLYKRVSGNSCGTRMPQGGTLTQTDIDLIRVWINQGAENN
jgi:hypothetical protein